VINSSTAADALAVLDRFGTRQAVGVARLFWNTYGTSTRSSPLNKPQATVTNLVIGNNAVAV